jgi:hypothetical protein
VTLKGVMVDIPDVFRPTMVCTIGAQPYIATSLLQPGAVLTCKSSYMVRLSDLEDGDHTATMTATAPTADLSVSRDITFVSQWRPEVSIEVNSAECSSVPAKAGESGAYICVPAHISALAMGDVTSATTVAASNIDPPYILAIFNAELITVAAYCH